MPQDEMDSIMPQLSLYITDDNLEALRARAKASGLSLSKYANRLIEQDVQNGGWPEGFWDLYGALDENLEIPDDPPPSDDEAFDLALA